MNDTVLEDFFAPAAEALTKVRYCASRFKSLSMEGFCLFGCLRHLQGMTTMREQIQQLFHLTDEARMPVARSTYSDALSAEHRQTIVKQATLQLVKQVRPLLPDRLGQIEELGTRSVYAADGSYQSESAHYQRLTPKQGGTDHPNGHMMLAFYDVRMGAPVDIRIETHNRHEMLVFKNYGKQEASLLHEKDALWVVDRAFVDMPFWDSQRKRFRQTVVTRMKENLVIDQREALEFADTILNEGVLSDEVISLKASNDDWRCIHYQAPDGNKYNFLTNEMKLAPGIIAFLYLRRWDEEKCFDTWKNDFSSSKAWSKSVVGITCQAWLAIMTSVLLLLFAHRRQSHWELEDEKSLKKQSDRIDEKYTQQQQRIPWYIFFYRSTSKVSRQVIRFLKHCFSKRSSQQLYDKQLRPMLVAYL